MAESPKEKQTQGAYTGFSAAQATYAAAGRAASPAAGQTPALPVLASTRSCLEKYNTAYIATMLPYSITSSDPGSLGPDSTRQIKRTKVEYFYL